MLKIIETKDEFGYQVRGVIDTDLGIVLGPSINNEYIYIFDDDNFFAKEKFGLSSYMCHYQRKSYGFELLKKGMMSTNDITSMEKINSELLRIDSETAHVHILYSPLIHTPSCEFSSLSKFLNDDGSMSASFEAPVYDEEHKFIIDYLVGMISETGEYIGPVSTLNSGETFFITNKTIGPNVFRNISEIMLMIQHRRHEETRLKLSPDK